MLHHHYINPIRLFNLLTMLLLIIILFTGCSSGTPPVKDATTDEHVVRLEFWTLFSGGDNQFMTEMVERFNDEYENIQIIQTNSRLDDYYTRLGTAILSGNAPDLAIIHATNMPQFVLNGYIEDMSEPAKEVDLVWENFNTNILESTIYDGRNYAVPLDTHALVMYYNKEFLRLAHVLDETGKPIIGKGEDGFIQFLEAIKQAVPHHIAPLAQPSTRIDSVWLWWSLYSQIEAGGGFYNKEMTEAVFDNAMALKALNFVNSLYESELIPPDIIDSFKMFYEGDAAVLITGVWGTGAFEQKADLDFGVIPVPTIYDQPAVWGDSHVLVIPINQQMTQSKRKAAMIFGKWLVENGEMWAAAGHVPSNNLAVKSNEFQDMKYRSDYAAIASYVSYWPRHVKQWGLNEVLIKQFEKMIYGQQSPEEALKASVKEINDEIHKEIVP